MKHGRRIAIGLAGGLALQTVAQAITADSPGNPYLGIVDRNVFALKPKPEVPLVPPTPEVPAQKITLQGIVKAFGKKQVLWKTVMPARPGEPAKEKSFMCSEGEREGEIEILEINELAGTVKVMNNGKPQSLSLEKDGMKPTGGPSAIPGSSPGVPGIPGIPGAPAVTLNTGIPASAGSTVTTFGGGGGAASVPRPLRTAPTTAAGYNAATSASARTLSQEEQIVMMEINRKLTEDKVKRGDLPPLPPTPLTGQ